MLKKVVFLLFFCFAELSFAGNGYFESLMDPQTGMIDCDKLEPVKRPEGYFAGKLIMDAGLRGFRIGGAQVSEKHCGFVINVGNASSADVREVIDEVRERVKQQFGVTLEPEVVFLGEF